MLNTHIRNVRHVNDTEEYTEFRLERSEHEDADIDDLPLSFLIKLSEDNLYTGNLKLSSKENNIKNDQDLCPVNSESSKDTASKSSQKCNKPAYITSKFVRGSGNQSVESKCSCALAINPKLVSEGIQYDKEDCQTPESVHSVQTSPSLQISQAIQCDIDDRIAGNVSSSNSLSYFESVKSVNRCICCKRDLEACEFLNIVDNDSGRIPENYSKENERFDSPKEDEQFSSEGNEISNASQNPVTSSSINVSSQVLSATNSCRNVVKKVAPLLTNSEMTGGVSSQDLHGDACVIPSCKDGDDCDTYLEKEAEGAQNLFQNQLLSDDIGRNEIPSAFDPVERADYVAKWINNLVRGNTSPPLSLVEETGDVVESSQKVSRVGAHQQCSNCPRTTMKRRINSDSSNETSNGLYQHSLSSSSVLSSELLITKNKHSNRKTLSSHNRRNMLLNQTCKRFNKGEKISVSSHLDVEERISSAIPVERIDYVASWIKNLNHENASPRLSLVEETTDVSGSNGTVLKVGTLPKRTNHQITKDPVNERSQQSLSSTSVSSEIPRTKNRKSNRTLSSPFYRDGDSSPLSVPKSLNDKLINEFENEDVDCAIMLEKFLASNYSSASQKDLSLETFETNQRKKSLCPKTIPNEESTGEPLKDNDKSVRTSKFNYSHRQFQRKLVVRETQSDSSSLDMRSPPKSKYISLDSVEPNGSSIPPKNHFRQPYTMRERKKIVNYIVNNNKFSSTKGQALWQDMERAKVCQRTWQSMKEHFRKQILPQIEYFHLDPGITQKFLSLRK